jgi:hypothetical protein
MCGFIIVKIRRLDAERDLDGHRILWHEVDRSPRIDGGAVRSTARVRTRFGAGLSGEEDADHRSMGLRILRCALR